MHQSLQITEKIDRAVAHRGHKLTPALLSLTAGMRLKGE